MQNTNSKPVHVEYKIKRKQMAKGQDKELLARIQLLHWYINGYEKGLFFILK